MPAQLSYPQMHIGLRNERSKVNNIFVKNRILLHSNYDKRASMESSQKLNKIRIGIQSSLELKSNWCQARILYFYLESVAKPTALPDFSNLPETHPGRIELWITMPLSLRLHSGARLKLV